MKGKRIYAADTPAGALDLPPLANRSRVARASLGYGRMAVAWLERNALFVAGVAIVAGVFVGKLPLHINQDAWLALVDGRYVAQHGLPQHDTLAALTHGARWIDQQWLAQLAIYGLDQLGGLALYSLVHIALMLGALGMAIGAARRLGGSESRVMWVLPVAAFLYGPAAIEVRTQGFALPLFIATMWLLVANARAPTRARVYLVFPLLVLWANLHGSASLGAGLAALFGACLIIEDLRAGRRLNVRVRGVVFLIGAPLCLLATPYGLSTASYYRGTLANPVFKSLVGEWRPITASVVLAVPFFAAAFTAAWALGRRPGRARIFETLALLVLTAGAIVAVRNVIWFALATLMLLPAMLTEITPASAHPARRRPRLNMALVAIGLTFALGSLIAVVSKPASWFEREYDSRALAQVVNVVRRQPDTRIYVDARFADWLLWHDPALAGRIAFDSRLELLTPSQMRAVSQISELPAHGTRDLLAQYPLLVLDPSDAASRVLLEQPNVHVILRGHGVRIATRSAAR